MTSGRGGQWGTLVGLQDCGPGAIGGVLTACRPTSPGEAGEGPGGWEGGRKEEQGTPTPAQEREEGGRRKGGLQGKEGVRGPSFHSPRALSCPPPTSAILSLGCQ